MLSWCLLFGLTVLHFSGAGVVARSETLHLSLVVGEFHGVTVNGPTFRGTVVRKWEVCHLRRDQGRTLAVYANLFIYFL